MILIDSQSCVTFTTIQYLNILLTQSDSLMLIYSHSLFPDLDLASYWSALCLLYRIGILNISDK